MYGNVFRGDCDATRTLELLDAFTSCGTIEGAGLKSVTCGSGKKAPTARFVALRVTKKSPIHIKEIQAFGRVTAKPAPVAAAKCGKFSTFLFVNRCEALRLINSDFVLAISESCRLILLITILSFELVLRTRSVTRICHSDNEPKSVTP